mmetsp:Transcript_36865/g.54912  ORF Transcript_36865/g.54912 Transcript_36865/m.54912 type:complete len:99 (+) Transcript_36865:299-595(+)
MAAVCNDRMKSVDGQWTGGGDGAGNGSRNERIPAGSRSHLLIIETTTIPLLWTERVPIGLGKHQIEQTRTTVLKDIQCKTSIRSGEPSSYVTSTSSRQ